MRESRQQHDLDTLAGSPRLTVMTKDVIPSWKRYGKGSNYLECWFSHHHKSISITAVENSYSGIRTTEKRVMLTVQESAARALYEQLKNMFEPKE